MMRPSLISTVASMSPCREVPYQEYVPSLSLARAESAGCAAESTGGAAGAALAAGATGSKGADGATITGVESPGRTATAAGSATGAAVGGAFADGLAIGDAR